MNVHNNDPKNFIDDPEDFRQYCRWILSGHEGNILQTNSTQVITLQLDVGSNSHVFTDIIMFTYTRPVKCNTQIINGKKSPAKSFGLVIVKIPKTSIIIPIWPSYYIPQNPQNTISQTLLKHYNKFIRIITEALICLKITTDTGNKIKVDTTLKKRYKQLLEFIKIDVLNIK